MKHRFVDDSGAGASACGLSRRAFLRRVAGVSPHLTVPVEVTESLTTPEPLVSRESAVRDATEKMAGSLDSENEEHASVVAASRLHAGGYERVHARALTLAENISVNHAIAQSVHAGIRPAVMRMWAWHQRGIVLGVNDSLSATVDLEKAVREGVEVTRRASGGPAVVLNPDRTIVYSLILPAARLNGLTVRERYAVCDSWALAVLRSLGATVRYEKNVIVAASGKTGISFQYTPYDGVLIHTCALNSAALGLTDMESARAAFVDAFDAEFTPRRALLCPSEVIEAGELLRTTFGAPQWLQRVP